MKRALALCLLICLAGCGSDEPGPEDPPAVENLPPVSLVIDGSRWVVLKSKRTFRLSAVNEGTEPLSDVRVTLTLPKLLEHVSSDPAAALEDEGRTLAWTFPQLAPGAEASVTLRLSGRDRGRDQIVLEHEGVKATKKIEVIGVPSLHVGTYDTEDPVAVGETTTYVVEVRNEGTQACTNVRVVCELPPKTSFVSARANDIGQAVDGSEVEFDPWPILRPGDKLLCKVTCKAEVAANVKFSAAVSCDQFSDPIRAEEATSIYR